MDEFTSYLNSFEFLKSLISGGIFWLLDIAIIVMLLPVVFAFWEKRRWLPMRKQLAQEMLEYVRQSTDECGIQLHLLAQRSDELAGRDTADDDDTSRNYVPEESLPFYRSQFEKHIEDQQQRDANFERKMSIYSACLSPVLSERLTKTLTELFFYTAICNSVLILMHNCELRNTTRMISTISDIDAENHFNDLLKLSLVGVPDPSRLEQETRRLLEASGLRKHTEVRLGFSFDEDYTGGTFPITKRAKQLLTGIKEYVEANGIRIRERSLNPIGFRPS